jgi:preprotein translocase subunit SecE
VSTAVEPTTPKPGLVGRAVTFYHDVMAELRKVTWPDVPQVRQATIGILIVVLIVGALIGLVDLIAQTVLVDWLPRAVR